MINRLINMSPIINETKQNKVANLINASVTEYAIAFLDGLSDTQRNRFKKMLENNIECGMSVAESYGIKYEDFIKEVKNQLNIK